MKSKSRIEPVDISNALYLWNGLIFKIKIRFFKRKTKRLTREYRSQDPAINPAFMAYSNTIQGRHLLLLRHPNRLFHLLAK